MKRINLPQFIGLLANVAVLGGLIFLALETRQNTIQLRAAASSSLTDSINDLNAAVHGDAILASIVDRGEQDLSLLDSVETRQFYAFQFSRLNLCLHVLVLETQGLTDIQFPLVEFTVQDFHRKPGLQQFARSIQSVWVGDKEFFNRLLVDPS